MQLALEAEARDWLGRDWCSRSGTQRRGYRNGCERKRVRTAEGRIDLHAPQIRDSDEPFRSSLLEALPGRSEQLRQLALEAYVRGLSTRDIEETFQDQDGQSLLSKDAVTEISEEIFAQYQAFRERDLSGLDVVYVFVDGVYESLRRQAKCKQAVFVCWAILADGSKMLLSLGTGGRESCEAWREFFRDMIGRGLRQPLLVVSDGAPGLIRAVDSVFHRSRRQRCIAHQLRNIANKLPRRLAPEVLPDFRAVYYAETREAADEAVKHVIERHQESYPEAVRCMLDDLDACLSHLEFPATHRQFIRTTNLLERCFVEQKRRTKIIPGFLHEKSCLKLVFGVLLRASQKWRRVKMSDRDLFILRNIRKLMGAEENGPYISSEFHKAA